MRGWWTEGEYRRAGTWQAWRALLIATNAILYGFADSLQPTPGRWFDVSKAQEHVKRVEDKWTREMVHRGYKDSFSGAPPFSKMPVLAQLWLHEQLEGLKY